MWTGREIFILYALSMYRFDYRQNKDFLFCMARDSRYWKNLSQDFSSSNVDKAIIKKNRKA
jgi:hypothetical protein